MARGLYLDSFESGTTELRGKALTYDAVKARVLEAGSFSVFEATFTRRPCGDLRSAAPRSGSDVHVGRLPVDCRHAKGVRMNLTDQLRKALRSGVLLGRADEPLDAYGRRIVRVILAEIERQPIDGNMREWVATTLNVFLEPVNLEASAEAIDTLTQVIESRAQELAADGAKATKYAWPQNAAGLIAMAREWGGVDGDDLLAADVLIHKLGQALADATCTDSPAWFTGRWRDWHRGHGCEKDDGKPRTPEGAAEIEAHS